MDLEHFHFIRPLWLAVIPLLMLLCWWWIRRTQHGSGWEGAVDNELLNVLLDNSHKKSGRWFGLCLILASALACVGVAGPAWEKLPQNVERKEDTLVILLDLSLSMLATDVQPSRLDRARQKVADVLRLRNEGQTGLVAYAGDAHAVVPLTDDTATIENLLFSLSPDMMPVFGSNPGHALELARELFTNSNYLQGRILMITDGIDDISSVSRHRNAAFPISILGIGTSDGAAIPLDTLRQPGRYLQTQEGNRVIALLDDERLREVAALTYGRYRRAEVGDADILDVLSTSLPSEDDTIEVEREFDTWADQGHWLALLLLPLALVSFRKGVFAILFVFVLAPPPPAYAGAPPKFAISSVGDLWNSLWQRSDQRGFDKLRHGQPEQAVVLFDDPQWKSSAQYRSGDYASSMHGFAQDNSATGHYNQGNALARLGEYELALQSYDKTLAMQPDHEDALFNKELVERLLQEKQQSEQQQNEDQQSQANNEQSDSEQDQQEQEQEQSENQQQEQENPEQQQNQENESEQEQQQGEQQQSEQNEDQASRDEKQEALEQWLRRVPDDPGGLLRRKFSHETKQRLRRGEYQNRQGDKLW